MGAFEQLFSLGRGEFEQRFSKNSNARGVAKGGGGARGGGLKLRFDWYIMATKPEFLASKKGILVALAAVPVAILNLEMAIKIPCLC